MPDLNRQATGANVEGYGEITAEAMKLGLTLQELEAISKALGQSTEDILKNSKSINLQASARAKIEAMSVKDRKDYLKSQQESLKYAEKELKAQIKVRQANNDDTKEQEEQLRLIKEKTKALERQSKEYTGLKEKAKEFAVSFKEDAVGTMASAFNKIGDFGASSFSAAEDILTNYNSSINARLQGTNRTFNDMAKVVTKNLSGSPFVKQQDVLSKINDAVRSGIAYNVELRSYLDVLSEDIISTFNAFDANVTRIVRAQQSDSTIARLGMETKLDQLFNTYFSDSSYLSDMFSSVRGAITDTELTLSRNDATEMEYVLQKWLGSLYSVGVSGSAISSIADAINKLGTGDVNALSGSPMQSLLAMSASRGGQDYAELLTSGLNASKLNTLMYSMVEYLSEIAAATSDNNVVSTAYGEAFGVGIADLKALANIGDTIDSIYGDMLSYTDAIGEVNKQLSLLVTRFTIPEMISNALGNAKYTAAAQIVNDPVLYTMYKAMDFIGEATGGVELPTISIMGNSIAIPELTGLIKAGMMGISSAMAIVNAAGNFADNINNITGLSGWGGEETITRGEGFSLQATTGSSYSGLMTNNSSTDITDSLVQDANESAKRTESKRTGKNIDESKDFDDLYNGLFDENNNTGVLSAVSTNTSSMDTHLSAIHDDLIKVTTENTLNVNLQTINGAPIKDSLPLHFSDMGMQQMQQFVAKLGASLGLAGTENVNNPQIHTLQDLINFIMDEVGDSSSDTSLNINLKSNEVEAASFLTNSGRSYGGSIS